MKILSMTNIYVYIFIDKIDKNGINRKNNNNKIRDLSGKGKVIVLWSFVQTAGDTDKVFMEEWLILEPKQISNSIHVKVWQLRLIY